MTDRWNRPERDSLTLTGAHSLALQEAATGILADAGFDVFGFEPTPTEPKPEPMASLTIDPLTILALAPEVSIGRGGYYLWSRTTTEADSIEAMMTDGAWREPATGRLVDGRTGIDAVVSAAADPMTIGPEGDPLGDHIIIEADGTTTYVDATPKRRRGRPRKPGPVSKATARKRAQREAENTAALAQEAERAAARIDDSLAKMYPENR